MARHSRPGQAPLLHAGGHVCPFEGNIKDTLDWLDRYLGAIR